MITNNIRPTKAQGLQMLGIQIKTLFINFLSIKLFIINFISFGRPVDFKLLSAPRASLQERAKGFILYMCVFCIKQSKYISM